VSGGARTLQEGDTSVRVLPYRMVREGGFSKGCPCAASSFTFLGWRLLVSGCGQTGAATWDLNQVPRVGFVLPGMGMGNEDFK
jgi:hypothetical protein